MLPLSLIVNPQQLNDTGATVTMPATRCFIQPKTSSSRHRAALSLYKRNIAWVYSVRVKEYYCATVLISHSGFLPGQAVKDDGDLNVGLRA